MAPCLLALLAALLPSGDPLRFDREGEPLPDGALARLGSYRGREPAGRHHLAAACPARNLLATALDSQVNLYDLDTGRRLAGLPIEDEAVYALTFSPDGQKLALAGSSQVVLLDLLTRAPALRLEGWPSTVSGLLFSPDGRWLIALETREGVRIWETATGKVHAYWKTPGRRLYQAAFSADGRTLAVLASGETAADRTRIRFWEFASGLESRAIEAHPERRSFVLWPDGRRVGVFTTRRVALFIPYTLEVIEVGEQPQSEAGLPGATVRDPGEPAERPPDPKAFPINVSCLDEVLLALSPDGRTLVVTDRSTNRFCNPRTGEVREVRGTQATEPRLPALLSFSADGQTLRTWRLGDRLRAWDREGKERLSSEGHQQPIRWLELTADGREVLSSENGAGPFHWWDTATFQQVLPRAAIGGNNDPFRVELAAADLSGKLKGTNWLVLALSTDQRLLAHAYKVSDEEQGLEIWDVGQKKRLLDVPCPKANIRGLAFSPDGLSLAVAGQPWGVGLFEVATGQLRRTFSGHIGPVNAVLFSADGRRLFSGGEDWTILVWDVYHPEQDSPASWPGLADLGGDANRAFRAMTHLVGQPRQALPLLREQVAALKPATAEQPTELIARLGSDHFEEREQAADTLLRLGARARKDIDRALRAAPSLDMERRLGQLLEDIDSNRTTEELRQLRMVEVLERLGSTEAQPILKALRDEFALVRVSAAARAALRRLEETRQSE